MVQNPENPKNEFLILTLTPNYADWLQVLGKGRGNIGQQ